MAARQPVRALVAALVVTGALVGCSSSSSSSACGTARQEALDPGYLQHVLPGRGVPPRYLTDPPTSGPHQPAPPVSGTVDQPLGAPIQVGLLEAGKVLIQHRGLGAADVGRLDRLAGTDVVVAPADHLPPGSTVVATAWRWKLTCSGFDPTALRRFTAAHAGKSPGQP